MGCGPPNPSGLQGGLHHPSSRVAMAQGPRAAPWSPLSPGLWSAQGQACWVWGAPRWTQAWDLHVVCLPPCCLRRHLSSCLSGCVLDARPAGAPCGPQFLQLCCGVADNQPCPIVPQPASSHAGSQGCPRDSLDPQLEALPAPYLHHRCRTLQGPWHVAWRLALPQNLAIRKSRKWSREQQLRDLFWELLINICAVGGGAGFSEQGARLVRGWPSGQMFLPCPESLPQFPAHPAGPLLHLPGGGTACSSDRKRKSCPPAQWGHTGGRGQGHQEGSSGKGLRSHSGHQLGSYCMLQ